MRKKLFIGFTALWGIIALTIGFAAAQTERVLYNFQASRLDGDFPSAGLVFDKAGNLYGTTFGGGKYAGGTVYEISPQSGGGWAETLLHTFATRQNPGAQLIIDGAGNLYGTTAYGGSSGRGIVFELSPQSGGGWTYTRLHTFGNNKDGQFPVGTLVFDAAGNLYGATDSGGPFGYGTLFELTPSTGGVWKEKILHSYDKNGNGAYSPTGSLAFDSSGNLYGMTAQGGTNPGQFGGGDGTVFKITFFADGSRSYQTIHEFGNGHDGIRPFAGLVIDAAGNLYGTAEVGGLYGDGNVFKLTPVTGGGWIRKTLHNFHGNAHDGANPLCTLLRDGAGNLYGTTQAGGAHNEGTVFKLTPASTGPWAETILHSFNDSTPGADGVNPYAGLIFDASGNLYGTTSGGGTNNGGTVFEITP